MHTFNGYVPAKCQVLLPMQKEEAHETSGNCDCGIRYNDFSANDKVVLRVSKTALGGQKMNWNMVSHVI